MTAIANNNMRVFSANQFLNAFDNKKINSWQINTSVSSGEQVFSNNYKYIAVTSGTTGTSAPAHTVGIVSDGGVDWLVIESFNNLDNFQNNVYITIGKTDSWDNPTIGLEDPINPIDNFTSEYDSVSSIMSAKRLGAADAKMSIERYDWESGIVYSEFNSDVESFNYPTPFYVISNNNIYKCLNNNNDSISTTQPTGTNAEPFVTPGDGYLWQFMAEINASDSLRFLTPSYAPVEFKVDDDGSAQWAVQQNAKSGSLSTIKVTNGGSGYTTATITIDPSVSGTTATATAIIESGVITGIQLSNIGQGYQDIPNVTISGDGSGATATAISAPKDGNGSNILTELNARYITINARFEDDENGYFPTTGENDFRQISVIVDPYDVNGELAEATRYIGPDHDSWDGAETSGLLELQSGSGQLLYSESLSPVVRSPGQVEDVKIVLKF